MGLKISPSRRALKAPRDFIFVLNFRIETINLEQRGGHPCYLPQPVLGLGEGAGSDRHLTRLRLVGKAPHKANGRTRMLRFRKTVGLFKIAHFSQFIRPKGLSSAGYKPWAVTPTRR